MKNIFKLAIFCLERANCRYHRTKYWFVSRWRIKRLPKFTLSAGNIAEIFEEAKKKLDSSEYPENSPISGYLYGRRFDSETGEGIEFLKKKLCQTTKTPTTK